MHAHAMQIAQSSYEHLDPSLVGNVRRILVSELSGKSNIAAVMEAALKARKGGHALPDGVAKKVLAEVVRLEAKGYQFEAAQASFDLLVAKCADDFTPHFKRIKWVAHCARASPVHALAPDARRAPPRPPRSHRRRRPTPVSARHPHTRAHTHACAALRRRGFAASRRRHAVTPDTASISKARARRATCVTTRSQSR